MAMRAPPIALFGYESSPFTHKVRLALRLRQIPYTFVQVPSMLPRPIFTEYFNLTYRKIPVLAIGKDLYIDTSLILEALHIHPAFENTEKFPALHPDARSRTLSRIFSSHYTDRPLFRLTTGLIPSVVWRTRFGTDRAELIGHKLDPEKLERKVPGNVASLDTFLSILEPLFSDPSKWLLDTEKPSAADISLYYQLSWGERISRGEGIENLTGLETKDGAGEGIGSIFNEERYPGLLKWFNRFESYMESLPNTEMRKIAKEDVDGIAKLMDDLNTAEQTQDPSLLPTAASKPSLMDKRIGLKLGTTVSVTPDDTGRGDPTYGTLIASSTEEVVIVPDIANGVKAKVKGVRCHFPRVGFVVTPIEATKPKL